MIGIILSKHGRSQQNPYMQAKIKDKMRIMSTMEDNLQAWVKPKVKRMRS